MNKKGFTLIELLAVIVILSIIMLIATPVIMGVIEEARQGAAKNSALGYIDAIEKHVMIQELKGGVDLQNATIDENTDIPHRGENPSSVSLAVSAGAVTNGYIQFGNYVFTVTDGVVALLEES